MGKEKPLLWKAGPRCRHPDNGWVGPDAYGYFPGGEKALWWKESNPLAALSCRQSRKA
jgi:hypothetical protein